MRNLRTIAAQLLLMLAFVVGSTLGQTGFPGIKVTVPFRFAIGGTNLSAGEYSMYSSRKKVWIQEASGRNVAVSFTGELDGKVAENGGKVVFDCYLGECFLSQVWIAGQKAARTFPKSKRQIQLARTSAGQEFVLLGAKPLR